MSPGTLGQAARASLVHLLPNVLNQRSQTCSPSVATIPGGHTVVTLWAPEWTRELLAASETQHDVASPALYTHSQPDPCRVAALDPWTHHAHRGLQIGHLCFGHLPGMSPTVPTSSRVSLLRVDAPCTPERHLQLPALCIACIWKRGLCTRNFNPGTQAPESPLLHTLGFGFQGGSPAEGPVETVSRAPSSPAF